MEEYEINSYRPKKKQSSAYVAFDNTALIKNNKKGASLIFKVGPVDLQRQDQSVVYLLLNTPIDKGDYIGIVNRFNANDAMAHLDNLAVAIQLINLDHQIKTHTAKLKKEEQLQERCEKRCDRLSDRKKAMQQKLAQNKASATNRDRKLSLRLTENQNALALHKAIIEKQRTDLTQLTHQKKRFQNK